MKYEVQERMTFTANLSDRSCSSVGGASCCFQCFCLSSFFDEFHYLLVYFSLTEPMKTLCRGEDKNDSKT